MRDGDYNTKSEYDIGLTQEKVFSPPPSPSSSMSDGDGHSYRDIEKFSKSMSKLLGFMGVILGGYLCTVLPSSDFASTFEHLKFMFGLILGFCVIGWVIGGFMGGLIVHYIVNFFKSVLLFVIIVIIANIFLI